MTKETKEPASVAIPTSPLRIITPYGEYPVGRKRD